MERRRVEKRERGRREGRRRKKEEKNKAISERKHVKSIVLSSTLPTPESLRLSVAWKSHDRGSARGALPPFTRRKIRPREKKNENGGEKKWVLK